VDSTRLLLDGTSTSAFVTVVLDSKIAIQTTMVGGADGGIVCFCDTDTVVVVVARPCVVETHVSLALVLMPVLMLCPLLVLRYSLPNTTTRARPTTV